MKGKRIALKTIKEKLPDGTEHEFSYLATITDAVRSGGLQGLTIGEMADRQTLVGKLTTAKQDEADHLDLTIDEYSVVKDQVSGFRFRVYLQAAVDLLTDIKYAPDIPEDEEETE